MRSRQLINVSLAGVIAAAMAAGANSQTTYYVDQSVCPNCTGDGSESDPFCYISTAMVVAAGLPPAGERAFCSGQRNPAPSGSKQAVTLIDSRPQGLVGRPPAAIFRSEP